MKDKLLHTATEMFLNLGFKSVTMDDIANEIGVSKKTIYKYYKNKKALVESTTAALHESCLRAIKDIEDKKYNPIQENFEIQKVFKEMFKNVSASPIYQLKKYYPQVHEKNKEKEIGVFLECFKENIKRGVSKGYYRKDTKIDLCAEFYFYLVLSVHENTIENDRIPVIERQTLIYHTRAIATSKGLQELDRQLQL